MKIKRKRTAAERRVMPPRGRVAQPAKIVAPPEGTPVAAVEEGKPDINRSPVAVCPRCGGGWFVELVQTRMVGPEVWAPGDPEATGTRRARIVVLECRKCNQLVELPAGG